ncbi:hypothetical protein BGW39_006188 [Mortierella sp. 14UC]|nr:hypothetical protein BGW39_006188 [Mortierella sp. 14UC]
MLFNRAFPDDFDVSDGPSNMGAFKMKPRVRKPVSKMANDARRAHAHKANRAAFKLHSSMLPDKSPLTIVDYTPAGEASEGGNEITDYDSDEDSGMEEERENMTFKDFVSSAGCREPLNASTKKILAGRGGPETEIGMVAGDIVKKIVASVKYQKQGNQTWSARKLSKEMNEGLQHFKRTESAWTLAISSFERDLTKSWNDNIRMAWQDLQAAKKK